MYVMDWETARWKGSSIAGGKGWNLARLKRYGFPVPTGAVISAAAYRLFLRQAELRDLLGEARAVSAADLATLEAQGLLGCLREAMVAAPLPKLVEAEIRLLLATSGLADRLVAVRSSATGEDSESASFAGIHESFLNVNGPDAVIAALKHCYASLWTERAVAYRRRLGRSDDRVAAAAVLLEMVPAQAAGVIFTCDPRTGRRDRLTLSAAPGLGEAVVGGTVTPDELTIATNTYPPAIVGRRAVAGRPPALTDAQVAELALLAGRVQDALGALQEPQDLEWAHDGERFWLLQARPVTTLPAVTFPQLAGQPEVWSNANLKEILPGVASPMNWSFLRSGMDTLLRAPLMAAGYPTPPGIRWVRLIDGRPYFTLSVMQWAFYDSLGSTPAEFSRMIGGHQPEIAVPAERPAQRWRRSLARLKVIVASQRAMRAAPRLFERVRGWCAVAESAPINRWSPADLLAKSVELERIISGFLPPFQLINGAAGACHQELFKLIEPAFGERTVSLVNDMLAGASGATSAEQGQRLVRLGNAALADETARLYFAAEPWQPGTWREALAGTAFLADFETYLQDYGHRGIYEVEAMNPRWREDPTYLLEVVRAQVLAGRVIDLPDQTARRESARRQVFGKLGRSPRGLHARYLTDLAARFSALREMSKSEVVRLIGVSRLLVLEAGRRLAEQGRLLEPADVFLLSWLDLEAYLAGRTDGEGFRALSADRAAIRGAQLSRTPPDVVIGEEAVAAPVTEVGPSPAGGAALIGLGVASGRATGRARVIRHPREGNRLQPGEILIAPSTDPAWTPLFLRAAGIAMEVGGYLSHGAIVAREYGLPAVVNVPGLLAAIHDGDTVTVDGSSGRVYIGEM